MIADPSNSAKPRKRRWLQFSLRTLLLATTAFAAWLAFVYVPAKRADWATKSLEAAGISICYDFQHVPGTQKHSYNFLIPKPGPAFLRNLLGDGLFRHADYINIIGKPLTADFSKAIECLPTLTGLFAEGSQVTDERLACISGLRQLDFLSLRDNAITNRGLVHLAKLTNLQLLDLGNNQIDDSGLPHLAGLKKLENLLLDHAKITNEGVQQLAYLTNLKVLDIRRTQVTKAGAEKLHAALPNCIIDPFYPRDQAADSAERAAQRQSFLDDQKIVQDYLKTRYGIIMRTLAPPLK